MRTGRPRKKVPSKYYDPKKRLTHTIKRKIIEEQILDAVETARKNKNMLLFGVEELVEGRRSDFRPKRRKAKPIGYKWETKQVEGINGYYQWGDKTYNFVS